MKWKLASIAVAAMLALIAWLVWWPARHSPPATGQGAPAQAEHGVAGPAAVDGATAPAPAHSPESGDGAGPTNSFIVCPGNPRCPQ